MSSKRDLAQLRGLVRQALAQPTFPPGGEDEDCEFARGYRAARDEMQEMIAPAAAPSARRRLIDRAAISIGLEPGGRGTGHLEALWDEAYKEGRRDALAPGPLL